MKHKKLLAFAVPPLALFGLLLLGLYMQSCAGLSGIGAQKSTFDQHRYDQDSIIGLHVETYFNEGQYSPLTHSLILAEMDSLIAYDSSKVAEANTVQMYVLAEDNWVKAGALEAKEQPKGASVKFYAMSAEINAQMWKNIRDYEFKKGR